MKILLIEDRRQRQDTFIKESKMNFNDYEDVLVNIVGDNYTVLSNQFKDNKKIENLDNYAVIVSHKSAFEDENTSVSAKLERYCKEHKKVLVWFSGGIDTNYYTEENGYELLEINSMTLYSENLQMFLDDFRYGGINPLILGYGYKWKLNIVLNALEGLNLFMQKEKKEKVLTSVFYRDNPYMKELSDFTIPLYVPEGNKISMDEIQKIKEIIEKYVAEEILV